MFALDSPIGALILGASGFLTAIATGVFVWLSSRKPRSEQKKSAIELAHTVLTETIEWQDKEIVDLRKEVRHLGKENRRLEMDLTNQRGKP